MTKLVVVNCPNHPYTYALLVEGSDGCGQRITPNRCCGNWSGTIAEWDLLSVNLNFRMVTNLLRTELNIIDQLNATLKAYIETD